MVYKYAKEFLHEANGDGQNNFVACAPVEGIITVIWAVPVVNFNIWSVAEGFLLFV